MSPCPNTPEDRSWETRSYTVPSCESSSNRKGELKQKLKFQFTNELTCELCVLHKPSLDQHQKACRASVKHQTWNWQLYIRTVKNSHSQHAGNVLRFLDQITQHCLTWWYWRDPVCGPPPPLSCCCCCHLRWKALAAPAQTVVWPTDREEAKERDHQCRTQENTTKWSSQLIPLS